MKDYKSLIADIRTEACELADKMKRLEVFMMSEDFCTISPEQKGLLEQQYDLMAKYKVTLVKRAHRINYEHQQQKAMTREPEKEDAREPERMEPHVFAAMEYEAHRQKKEAGEVKEAPKCPRESEYCRVRQDGYCTAPETHCYKSAQKPDDAQEER